MADETGIPDVIVADPENFDLNYEINPHMDSNSDVNSGKARKQWNNLRETYRELGFEVQTLEVAEEFEDIVFTANHGVAYTDAGEVKVLLSNMKEDQRKGEIQEIKDALEEQGIPTEGPTEAVFEGSGDAMEHPDEQTFWLGHGQRTEKAAAEEIEQITGYDTETLKLVDPAFYHLDTCFEHLNHTTALVYPPAIKDAEKLDARYDTLIEVPENEALNEMAANAYCPDGQNVIINSGNPDTHRILRNHGFNVIETDTSEYTKSGGSVY